MMKQSHYLVDNGLVKQEKKLYHYTNVDSMKKILLSDTLLATHIQYMNDWSEYQKGYRILYKELKELESIELVEKGLLEEEKWSVVKEKIEELPDECPVTAEDYRNFIIEKNRTRMEMILPDVYSVSFCGEADLLNQWTNYAKENGVCLEFDFSDFVFQCPDVSDEIYKQFGKNTIDKTRVYKGYSPMKVVYEESAMRDIIKRDITSYLQNLPGKTEMEIEELWWKEMGNVFSIVPFFKHAAFAPEKEIRLAVRRLSKALNYKKPADGDRQSGIFDAEIHYIGSGSILKPRLKLQWRQKKKNGLEKTCKKTPVKSIIVGPGTNQEMTYRSIIYFIENTLDTISSVGKSEMKKLEIAEVVQAAYTGMKAGYVTDRGIIVRKSGIPYIY